MKRWSGIVAGGEALFAFSLCFSLSACRSQPVASAAAIAFRQVPTENSEPPDKMRAIAGRVTGPRPGQRIVLYARNDGRWGLQSPNGQPFTKIEDDGRWSGST